MPKPHYLMQFFSYEHLPEAMQKVSAPFCVLARSLDEILLNNPEKSTSIRKLLEAKDCAVRSVIWKEPSGE